MSLRTHRPVAAALNAEMPEHLGHEKHRAEPDRTGSNVRNGTRSKTGANDHPAAQRGGGLRSQLTRR
jgi:transposase-like protein